MKQFLTTVCVGIGVLIIIFGVSMIILNAPGPVPMVATPSASPSPTTYGDGLYEIGSDIPAGTYKSKGGDSCYWELLSTSGKVVRNHYGDGPEVVVITKTGGAREFSTQGCGHWRREA